MRVICQGAEGRSLWNEGLRLLDHYSFGDPVNQVVFDALRRIRRRPEGQVRQQLQRELVLARFPGLNAAEYFEPHGLHYGEAVAALESLASAGKHAH